MRKTNEQFLKEVSELSVKDYVFLDEYKKALEPISVKHKSCGNIYKVSPSNFLRGKRCPYCMGKRISLKKTKSKQEVLKEIYEIVGKEYELIGDYTRASSPILFKHIKCGNTFKMTIGHFRAGERCPSCSYKHRALLKTKSHTEFLNQIYNLYGNKYTICSQYKGDANPITIQCNTCNKKYKGIPTRLLQGFSTCPYCNQPRGELLISLILDSKSIVYEVQKTFPNLTDIKPLSYDFYIPSYNILIEYQGEQHYKSKEFFGGNNAFDTQRRHDKIKRNYATKNNIRLIEVPYTENTFTKIENFLINNKVIWRKAENP